MDIASFKFLNLPEEVKLILLEELGYRVNKKKRIVHLDTNKPVICKYTKRPIYFNNASILPGSTVIINTTPLSLSEYIGEYLEEDEF